MPNDVIYLDVLIGAFVASFVGNRLLLGLTIAFYAIAWKLIGAFFSSKSLRCKLSWTLFNFILVGLP